MRAGSRGLVNAVCRPVAHTLMLGSSVAVGLSQHDVVTGQAPPPRPSLPQERDSPPEPEGQTAG
jgi:hypothetical protein